MIIFKNIFSFILTFYAYNWLIVGGIQHTLVAISIVQVVVCVLSIPMCMSSFEAPRASSFPFANRWTQMCMANAVERFTTAMIY